MRREAMLAGCAVASLLLAAGVSRVSAQDLQKEATEHFSRGDYPGAVARLEEAVRSDSLNAELHYLLGYYTHYLCNDTRPVCSCDQQASDRILAHLARARALAPGHGNAAYFSGAERGARARKALGRGDLQAATREFRAAQEEGAVPAWLLEYARNMLRSCEPNAILFACGDAEMNPIEHLQLVEGLRTDVTAVALGFLDVPWYALHLKQGLPGATVPAPIAWSDDQILGMRPFKWKPNEITVLVDPAGLAGLQVGPADSQARWTLEPDLTSASGGSFLSPGHALLTHIIETNGWRRPVYMTIGCPMARTPELEPFLQLCGLTHRVLPVPAEPHGLTLDQAVAARVLLDPENFRDLPSVREHDMPRVSGMLQNYRVVFMNLAAHRAAAGDTAGAREALQAMKRQVPEDLVPLSVELRGAVEALEKQIEPK